MRCKAGDMVVVIGGQVVYRGLILQVTRLDTHLKDHWQTEPRVENGMEWVLFSDNTLLPLKGLPELEGIETDNPVRITA